MSALSLRYALSFCRIKTCQPWKTQDNSTPFQINRPYHANTAPVAQIFALRREPTIVQAQYLAQPSDHSRHRKVLMGQSQAQASELHHLCPVIHAVVHAKLKLHMHGGNSIFSEWRRYNTGITNRWPTNAGILEFDALHFYNTFYKQPATCSGRRCCAPKLPLTRLRQGQLEQSRLLICLLLWTARESKLNWRSTSQFNQSSISHHALCEFDRLFNPPLQCKPYFIIIFA